MGKADLACVQKFSGYGTANIERDQISNSDRIVLTTGRLMIKNKTVTRLEVSKTAFFLFFFLSFFGFVLTKRLF